MLILRSFKHILQYNMLVKFVFWRSCPCDKGEYCEINCGYFVIMACIIFSIYTYFDQVLSGDLHDIYEHLFISLSETGCTCVCITFYFSFFVSQSWASINESKGKIYTWWWEAIISRIHRKWCCIKVCQLCFLCVFKFYILDSLCRLLVLVA